jgi:DNA ligase (NAD+)
MIYPGRGAAIPLGFKYLSYGSDNESVDMKCNGAKSLEKVEITGNIKIISYSAFLSCKGLKEIIFPSELKEIGANLFCPNTACKPRVIAKLVNFASKSGMNIEGFSEKTAGLLYEQFNIFHFADLYKIDKEKLLDLDGYKDAKTNNLLSAIEKSKSVPFENFIFALGIDNVGKKTAKDLSNSFSDLFDLMQADKERLIALDDVGEVVADCIFEYFSDEKNKKEIEDLLSVGINIIYSKKSEGGIFKGEKVVLTGTLAEFKRDEASKLIESLGGEIMSGVSKNTTLVLAGENAGSKLDKATALGIKIIDEETFKDLVKNLK